MTRESYKKHKELIEAWGAGAEIEYREDSDSWRPVAVPQWHLLYEYRIKSKDETLYEWMIKGFSSWWIANVLYTIEEAKENFKGRDYKQTGRSWKL